jgi:SAM-dependent methyltransferase
VTDDRWAVRALSFGSAAEQYERFREGYPDELVDTVLDYAGRPVRTALEVGAGTGKATRVIAGRGIEVTALEPDPGMASVLARTTDGLPVRTVGVTFEQYTTDSRYDLVYSAAAWHWTDPATRWSRAAALLVPGGVLAVFGRPSRPADERLRAAIEQVEAGFRGDDRERHRWSPDEVEAVDALSDVTTVERPERHDVSAADFLGRLQTLSAYLVLDDATRAAALAQVEALLPPLFEVDTTLRITLARRV